MSLDHVERRGGIGSSDAACLYGKNKWKTIEQLFNEKIAEEIVVEPTSFIMARGVRLEPILRRKFSEFYFSQKEIKDPFDPKTVRHPEKEFIRANLDGLSKCGSVLIECKYQGKASLGTVPEQYFIQIMHQMACSGATHGYLVAANEQDASDIRITEVLRDEAFINQHLILCEQFWMNVQARKAPPSLIEILEDEKALSLADEHERLVEIHKEIEEEMARVKEELIKFCTKDETKVGKLNIKKILTKGSIDYSRIEALKSIDLEQFRKEPRVSYRITVD